MVMFALVVLVLFTIIFIFSILASIAHVHSCSLTKSVDEVFEFTAEATYMVNVISESQVGDGTFPGKDGGFWWFWTVSCIIFIRDMLNGMEKIRHSWRIYFHPISNCLLPSSDRLSVRNNS
ncbi:hypothetical protein DPMN_152225 [Dreissena polymorpha]|uniref:Uncharacterized protein n=1 Tax=Dreissena polymorpha TaxID=45954 RepID=A0A9D4FGG0_DREPO|nr:hypothetical protein DPMN_152225 [Dreissena polymorpha]